MIEERKVEEKNQDQKCADTVTERATHAVRAIRSREKKNES